MKLGKPELWQSNSVIFKMARFKFHPSREAHSALLHLTRTALSTDDVHYHRQLSSAPAAGDDDTTTSDNDNDVAAMASPDGNCPSRPIQRRRQSLQARPMCSNVGNAVRGYFVCIKLSRQYSHNVVNHHREPAES